MIKRILRLGKREVKRVNKREARRRYNNGEQIYIAPHKANIELFGGWFSNENDSKFESIVNAYEFLNCNTAELGKYAAFYVEKKREGGTEK